MQGRPTLLCHGVHGHRFAAPSERKYLDDVRGERDQPHLVLLTEERRDFHGAALELVDGVGGAGTRVEQQREIDRHLLDGDRANLLPHAVIEELEVGRAESGDGRAAGAHGDVHRDAVGPPAKDLPGFLRRD